MQPVTPVPAAPAAAANTYTDVNALAALKKDPSSPAAIKAVAQQVDALFLQMMLKSMRDANAEVGEPESNEMGMYQDMFDKQIALQLSQHQGLGLGAQLTRQLSAQAAAGTGAAAPAARPLANVTAPASGAAAADNSPTVSPDTSSGAAPASSPSQFVSLVYPAIQRAAAALGLSPLGMLAQAALETGWGRRMARTAAGTPSLNMFGIKADDSWSGARAGADTIEFTGGSATLKHTAFRAYHSIEASVGDFAELIGNSARYRDALAAGGDAQAYVTAIGKSGYATDPEYGKKLNAILNSSTFHNALKAAVAAL
jgi:peptidoglycan hydrolase FlgJ